MWQTLFFKQVRDRVVGMAMATAVATTSAVATPTDQARGPVDDLVIENLAVGLEVEVPHTDEADLSQAYLISFPEEKKPQVRVRVLVPAAYAAPVSDHEALFQEFGERYGIDPEKLKRIAHCESGYNAGAVSPNGLYGGLYQFVNGTWISNRNAMGLDPNPELRFDAREAVHTAAFKMSRDGFGAWPVCGRR